MSIPIPFNFAPPPVTAAFSQALEDRTQPSFAQVATIYQHAPEVRTVHLRLLPEVGSFGFSTHRGSAKWREMDKNNRLSGCYYQTEREIQWRWSGKAEVAHHSPLIERLWFMTRSDVRLGYWNEYCRKDECKSDINVVCPAFGVIICRPEKWDVYDLSSGDYSKQTRVIYQLELGQWQVTAVSTLDGLVLTKQTAP